MTRLCDFCGKPIEPGQPSRAAQDWGRGFLRVHTLCYEQRKWRAAKPQTARLAAEKHGNE